MQQPPPVLDLTRIVEQQRARVRRVLRARGVAERDVPDAEQEVFLVVHRKLAEFEGRSSVATWLHRIAINVASEHRRKARHRYELLDSDALPEASASGADPQARLEARDALERVRAALDALSAEQREAFLLHELVGLSMHEVAARLHVPLKTAFSRFYAARRGLAAALAQRGIAVSALWTWFGLALPSRLLSRAKALVPKVARVSLRAAQLPLMSVALLCSVLPALAPVHAPTVAPPVTRLDAVALAPARRVRPAVRVATPPSRAPSAPAIASRVPAFVARVTPRAVPRTIAATPRRQAAAAVTVTMAVVDAAPVEALPEDDELIVTRSGALDLRPQLEHPFAARVATRDTPSRIVLHGPRDAASALEESLTEAQLP